MVRIISNSFIVGTAVLLLLTGCYQEVALPVTAGFEYQVSNNFTIPARITFTNTTAGGETFLWTFEGGEPATSTKKTPGEIVYKKAGTYTIRLEANNFDGRQSVVEKKVVIDNKLLVNFEVALVGNTYAPATVNFTNKSAGFDKLEWSFEGGTPATSVLPNPVVTFADGGPHKVSLKLSNARSTATKDTVINLAPELTPDFVIVVPPQYEELEAPVELNLKNKSVGLTSLRWTMDGADVTQSQADSPTVRFSKEGIYIITLEVSNGKKSKKVSQSITIKPSKGYAYIRDVELGIFSARNSTGIYYSTTLRKAFSGTDLISEQEASTIDLLFFGLDEAFIYNRFLSPDDAASIGLKPIPGVGKTVFLNPAQVTAMPSFDNLDEAGLSALQLGQATADQDNFFTESSPKLVLFENSQQKKGVIMIKSFVKDGASSRIRFDVKVLK